MIKVLYRPAGMLVSVLGGVAAGAIFKQVWKVTFGEDDAPEATDADRSWCEVLLAAALQGAIFGLVKAAVDRGAAAGTRQVTGVWPGDDGQKKGIASHGPQPRRSRPDRRDWNRGHGIGAGLDGRARCLTRLAGEPCYPVR